MIFLHCRRHVHARRQPLLFRAPRRQAKPADGDTRAPLIISFTLRRADASSAPPQLYAFRMAGCAMPAPAGSAMLKRHMCFRQPLPAGWLLFV
jgi:hypothetical protein